VAVYTNGKMAIIDTCAGSPAEALALTYAELSDAGCESPELLAAFESKLSGDEALAAGEPGIAALAYTSALAGAPSGLLSDERAASVIAAEGYTPPRLMGLPPSRAAALMTKEREKTLPGRVRWIHGAFVGRSRAKLVLGETQQALADAREAVSLCPLALLGWEQLAAVADATGDQQLLSEANTQMQRLQTQGTAASPNATPSPPVDREAAQAAATDSRIKAGAAYAVAVGGILLAIFKKQVLEGPAGL